MNFGRTSGFDPFAAADRFGDDPILDGAFPDPLLGVGLQPFESEAFLEGSFGSFDLGEPSFGSFGSGDSTFGRKSLAGETNFDVRPEFRERLPLTPAATTCGNRACDFSFDNGFNTAIGVAFPLVAAGGAAGFRAAQPFVRPALGSARFRAEQLFVHGQVAARALLAGAKARGERVAAKALAGAADPKFASISGFGAGFGKSFFGGQAKGEVPRPFNRRFNRAVEAGEATGEVARAISKALTRGVSPRNAE